MEWIESIPLDSLGPSVLVGIAVLALIRGDLVPRKQYDAVVSDRDDWRRIALQALDVNAKAVEAAETTATVINALPRHPSRDQQENPS